MKIQIILPMLIIALMDFANAIVIIPPVVYFVTLSIGTFISSSIVSLLLFGALKGFADRKYFGKSPFELLHKAKSGLSTFLLAIACMLLSLLAIYPIDQESTLIAAAISSALFLLLKFIFSLREYGASSIAAKRSLLMNWIAFAAFIAIAFSFSALLSIQSYRVITGTGGQYPSQQVEKSPLSPLADALLGAGAPASSASQNSLIAPSAGEKSSVVQTLPNGLAESKELPIAGNMRENASVSPTAPPSPRPEQKIWFIPNNAGACTIFADSFVQSFSPSYSCLADEGGARVRIFCPVYVSFDRVSMRGTVEFKATGSCVGAVTADVTQIGFENIR